jgi:two-component system LytT family sensor kinase
MGYTPEAANEILIGRVSALRRGTILWLGWTAIAVLSYTRHYLQQTQAQSHVAFWSELPIWLACYYAWIPLAPLIFRLEKIFPIGKRSWLRSVPVLAAASLPFTYAAFLLTFVLTSAVRQLQHRPVNTPQSVWAMPGIEFCLEQLIFWSVIAATVFLRTTKELGERQREASRLSLEKAQLEATLRQTELDVLRMRLNPHFLFNALQNISVLARPDPATASRMLTRLGDLLRAALRRDFQSEVTLDAEIALIRGYTDIEKMRFRGKLAVDVDIAPGTAQARVPSLLLQPLVENAIIHGLAGASQGGRICIRSTLEAGRLVLSVTDNGSGAPPGEFDMGVGLGSLRERLARMYPGDHEIRVHRLIEGGTEVRVSFPFHALEDATVSAHESSALVNR